MVTSRVATVARPATVSLSVIAPWFDGGGAFFAFGHICSGRPGAGLGAIIREHVALAPLTTAAMVTGALAAAASDRIVMHHAMASLAARALVAIAYFAGMMLAMDLGAGVSRTIGYQSPTSAVVSAILSMLVFCRMAGV